MFSRRLVAAAAVALHGAAERADRSETLALAADWAARHRVVRAGNGTAAETATADTGEFPYNTVTDFLGDDSKGLVKEDADLAAHLSGELNTKAGEAVGKADEYSGLLKQLHAGNDLVVATVHDFKTAVGEHAKGKLQESVSEVTSAAEGGGSSVGAKEAKFEDVTPSQEMTAKGVEEFAATQFGLQAITFEPGDAKLTDDAESRVEEEFVKPLKRNKEKADSGAKFLFCIFYSTTAGADNVKEGLMQERGKKLEDIVTKHAKEVLGEGNFEVGGKFEGYSSDRLGAIVYKVTKAGQDAACSEKDAEIAESGKAA